VYKNVPFYQTRLHNAGFKPGTPMDAEIWGKIPVLTRAEVFGPCGRGLPVMLRVI